jgi:hypothetical protein
MFSDYFCSFFAAPQTFLCGVLAEYLFFYFHATSTRPSENIEKNPNKTNYLNLRTILAFLPKFTAALLSSHYFGFVKESNSKNIFQTKS